MADSKTRYLDTMAPLCDSRIYEDKHDRRVLLMTRTTARSHAPLLYSKRIEPARRRWRCCQHSIGTMRGTRPRVGQKRPRRWVGGYVHVSLASPRPRNSRCGGMILAGFPARSAPPPPPRAEPATVWLHPRSSPAKSPASRSSHEPVGGGIVTACTCLSSRVRALPCACGQRFLEVILPARPSLRTPSACYAR
jgi:hypothetical protein